MNSERALRDIPEITRSLRYGQTKRLYDIFEENLARVSWLSCSHLTYHPPNVLNEKLVIIQVVDIDCVFSLESEDNSPIAIH